MYHPYGYFSKFCSQHCNIRNTSNLALQNITQHTIVLRPLLWVTRSGQLRQCFNKTDAECQYIKLLTESAAEGCVICQKIRLITIFMSFEFKRVQFPVNH